MMTMGGGGSDCTSPEEVRLFLTKKNSYRSDGVGRRRGISGPSMMGVGTYIGDEWGGISGASMV